MATSTVSNRIWLEEPSEGCRVMPCAVVVEAAGLGIDALSGEGELRRRVAPAVRVVAKLGECACRVVGPDDRSQQVGDGRVACAAAEVDLADDRIRPEAIGVPAQERTGEALSLIHI